MKKLLALILLGAISALSLDAMKRSHPEDSQSSVTAPVNPSQTTDGIQSARKKLKPKEQEESLLNVSAESSTEPNTGVVNGKQPVTESSAVATSITTADTTTTTATTVASSHSSSSTTKEQKIVLGKRPKAVQAAIDKAFEEIKNKKSGWGFDGSFDSYGILGLNDDLVLKNLASKKGKDDIYIIDAGCAQGAWGEHAMKVLLESEVCRNSGKRFHIFSITGGQECTKKNTTKDNVTLYIFNQFKIENIDEEFSRRGLDLSNKVDLIVSHWTLRHLIDPLGTLKRMYGLLTPLQGMLLANDFFFTFDSKTVDAEAVETFPCQKWNFLDPNVVSLFGNYHDFNSNVGQFLLMRTNNQELEIPFEYAGDVCELPSNFTEQTFGRCLTVFKRGEIKQSDIIFLKEKNSSEHYSYYCDKQNQRSKDLYAYLLKQKLFQSC
jgi:hypothetical protein